MSLHWIDLIVLIVLAFTAINGMRRGLIRSVFDILAMVVAILVSFIWYKNLTFILVPYLKISEMMANVISFTVSWLIVFFAVQLLGTVLHNVLGKSFFSPFNLLGGALLGMAKGLIVVGIIINLIIVFPMPEGVSAELHKSVAVTWVLPVVGQIYEIVFKVMPKDVPYVSDFFEVTKTLNSKP